MLFLARPRFLHLDKRPNLIAPHALRLHVADGSIMEVSARLTRQH